MKLPFLKPIKSPGTIMVSTVDKKGDVEHKGEEGEHHPGLMAASEDLISAVHSKDSKRVADALKAAHEINGASADPFDAGQESQD